MKWIERQKRIEQEVYSSIDSLCDEFNLELGYYPEVYWVGRSVNFEFLGLPDHLEEEFNNKKKNKISSYFVDQNAIFINQYRWHDIFEESSHFFHISLSSIDFNDEGEYFWKRIITEMIGFLGGRILGSDAINMYIKYPDMALYCNLRDKKKYKPFFQGKENIEELDEFVIYQQGYGLADVLFYNMEKGKIKKREIKDILLDDFDERGSAKEKFFELRERFWPLPNKVK